MRAHLIANPMSGSDRAVEMLPRVTDRLRTLFDDLVITVTAGEDDVRRAGARAVDEQCAAVFVAGGDGTLNGALRGMMERDPGLPIPIGLIPFGTGNDFAKALGLGEEPECALERLLDPHLVPVDVGLMNDRPFLNISAGGLIAEASGAVTPALKDITGKLAYLIGGARALLSAMPLHALLFVAGSGNRDRGAGTGDRGLGIGDRIPDPRPPIPDPQLMPAGECDVQMFAVCNAPFIGGGHAIAPAALVDDGLLDVLVVPRMSFVEFLATLRRIAASGNPGRDDVLHFRSSAIDLVFDRVAQVNVDGEVLEASRCAYRVRSRGARCFCGPEPLTSSRPVPWQRGHQ
jgi:diacylglycerol kinase (ATP)